MQKCDMDERVCVLCACMEEIVIKKCMCQVSSYFELLKLEGWEQVLEIHRQKERLPRDHRKRGERRMKMAPRYSLLRGKIKKLFPGLYHGGNMGTNP